MPPAVPPVPARQPGESRYAYQKRRSVQLTGQTPYQRRIARGAAAGQSRGQARGHGPVPGVPGSGQPQLSEYQRRAQRTMELYGQTPYQRRIERIDAWLTDNGYTPDSTGLSWTRLRTIYARLRWIQENSSQNGGIDPYRLGEAVEMEGYAWVIDRLYKKYDSMVAFRNGSNQPGNFYWFWEGGQENAGTDTANWWYYH